MLCISTAYSFLLLGGIPSCGYLTGGLSIYLLFFGRGKSSCCEHSCTDLCVDGSPRFWAQYLGEEYDLDMARVCLTFWETFVCFLKYSILHSHYQYATNVAMRGFKIFSFSNMCIMVSHCDLILCFPNALWCGPSFKNCVYLPYLSSLVKCLFRFIAHFCVGCFLVTEFWEFTLYSGHEFLDCIC